MERKINYLSICYTLFLILLFLSGSLFGWVSEAVYLSAFLIPLLIGVWYCRDEKEPIGRYLSIKGSDVGFILPLVFPTILLVMLLSFVSSYLIYTLTGVENSVDVGDSFVPALIIHALLPAIFEEALFRYLPMRMLSGYSKRVTVLLSAFLFALVHHSFFSFGYALLAGVVFMAIDLACDSVIPSVIIHFINNALSVGMIIFTDNPAFAPAVIILVGILSLISVIYLVIYRAEYKRRFSEVFKSGEKFSPTVPLILLGAVCLVIAVVSIL